MELTAILDKLQSLGVSITVADDRLRLEPGSRVPPQLLGELRRHKWELLDFLLAPLPESQALADELERLMVLGQRLKRGEITAIRCGKTGQLCRACAGVPCFSSQPWGGS